MFFKKKKKSKMQAKPATQQNKPETTNHESSEVKVESTSKVSKESSQDLKLTPVAKTLEVLKEIAKDNNVKNYYNLNKFDLVLSTWNFVKKEDLVVMAKEEFKIEKTSSMNKEDLIKAILATKTVPVLKEVAKKLNIAGYSSAKSKAELINKLVNA